MTIGGATGKSDQKESNIPDLKNITNGKGIECFIGYFHTVGYCGVFFRGKKP